jgi:hypothetical protein
MLMGKYPLLLDKYSKMLSRDNISPWQKKIEVILELHIYENRKDVIFI